MAKCLFSYDIWWVMNNFCYIDFYNFWQDESKNLYILENTLKILKFIYNILVFVPISKPLNLMSWKTWIYSLVAHYKLIFFYEEYNNGSKKRIFILIFHQMFELINGFLIWSKNIQNQFFFVFLYYVTNKTFWNWVIIELHTNFELI